MENKNTESFSMTFPYSPSVFILLRIVSLFVCGQCRLLFVSSDRVCGEGWLFRQNLTIADGKKMTKKNSNTHTHTHAWLLLLHDVIIKIKKNLCVGQNGFFTIWPFGLRENMSQWRLMGIWTTCGRNPRPKRQQSVHRGSSSRSQNTGSRCPPV